MRDLRLIDELAHLSEIEMLEIKNDKLINKYLAILGFDIQYGMYYGAAVHRDLRGNVSLGFRIVGEVEINKSFIDGPFATVREKLIAYSYSDRSWAKELAELTGKSPDFKEVAEEGLMAFPEISQEFPPDQCNEGWESVAREIEQLERIRDEIRGCMWAANGSLKTPEEYQVEINVKGKGI